MKKNYLLGVDMQTHLQKDNLPTIGKPYSGTFIRIGEWEGTFVEKAKCETDGKRNFPYYNGQEINGTIRFEDRHVRLNFKELYFNTDYDIEAFAERVKQEVKLALFDAKSLLEESQSE